MARKLARLALVPLALLCVGIMRLLHRWGIVTIRIGSFYPPRMAPRIGHTAMNTECYLCERDAGMHPEKAFDIWTWRGPSPNETHKRMLWEQMLIDPTRFAGLVHVCNTLFEGWQTHVAASTQMDRDIYNLLEHQKPHLRLRHRDDVRACKEFKKWGVPWGAKFVCLIVRDAAYLPTYTYHNYRDCDVDAYADAALWLAEQGYYVFRMGAKVAKPFAASHPRIFDYATNGMRSDFMDVYLGAKCLFTISTSTGWDAIPQVFRKPICYTNFPQFEYLPTWQHRSLAIWKHHEKDGRRMSIAEIIESKIGHAMRVSDFEAAGISLRENTPQEIQAVVQEMVEWVEGRWCPAEQTDFWERYPRSQSAYDGQPLHGKMRLRIGASFLAEAESVQKQEDIGGDSGARRLEARTA